MEPIKNPGQLIRVVRESLFKPELDKVQAAMPAGQFHGTQEGQDYCRLLMYHNLVAQYIVHGVMIEKITDDRLQTLCSDGGTKDGLERLAAHVFMTMGISNDAYGEEEQTRVLHDSFAVKNAAKSH